MKRILDILLSAIGLFLASPVLLPVMFLVWWKDKHSPFYIASRVGKDGNDFRMVKLRSMVINADKSGVDSTASDDRRITPVGHFIRRYKLDELSQLYNVLKGDMSLVGPRPNVRRDTDLYTSEERRLLSVRPGITDFSSIVFADEGEILKGSADPDLKYNQVIRPWKSRLGLLYVDKGSTLIDLQLIVLTALAIVSRQRALAGVHRLVAAISSDEQLKLVCLRQAPLTPYPPPGATEIVCSREVANS
ncbi:MAG: sugar transferase [Proteobacteria bacterium]|nr:sugar transferase [Pseudomonadota bacterium]